jgi:methylthioribose-1-phosphate isomerase
VSPRTRRRPPEPTPPDPIVPVSLGERSLRILDQRRLPSEERVIEATDVGTVVEAIRTLAVRGAPLLGITAAYGLVLASRRSTASGPAGLRRDLERAGAQLASARPTAVNLRWAVERVLGRVHRAAAEGALPRGQRGIEAIRGAVLDEALRIAVEDEAACTAIGRLGAELLPAGARVLTHCNTGALATGGWGTAQGILVAARAAGNGIEVWVDETRPLLQGARLTAWELLRMGVPSTLVVDGAAGSLMARGLVDAVVVGADRIAANGDVANKVGTYSLAVLATHHRVPFYVAAPTSTIDPAASSGPAIEIEDREADEVRAFAGLPVAPAGVAVANPAFDVTPAGLVTAIVTEHGVARAPYGPRLAALLDAARAGEPLAEAGREAG